MGTLGGMAIMLFISMPITRGRTFAQYFRRSPHNTGKTFAFAAEPPSYTPCQKWPTRLVLRFEKHARCTDDRMFFSVACGRRLRSEPINSWIMARRRYAYLS